MWILVVERWLLLLLVRIGVWWMIVIERSGSRIEMRRRMRVVISSGVIVMVVRKEGREGRMDMAMAAAAVAVWRKCEEEGLFNIELTTGDDHPRSSYRTSTQHTIYICTIAPYTCTHVTIYVKNIHTFIFSTNDSSSVSSSLQLNPIT
ncbi:hypothetical protein Hanom_Chr01g00094841 [Helianthus anomalus]